MSIGWGELCSYGGRAVTNGMRADSRGCAYGSVCGHLAHGASGFCLRHMAWHMAPALDVRMHTKRGCVSGHLPIYLCGYMWVGWTDGNVGSFEEGVYGILAQL